MRSFYAPRLKDKGVITTVSLPAGMIKLLKFEFSSVKVSAGGGGGGGASPRAAPLRRVGRTERSSLVHARLVRSCAR